MDNYPNVLNADSREILQRRGFVFLRREAASFWVSWFFENGTYKFVLAVDRGYYEAQLTHKATVKQVPVNLIHLLRTIKKDGSFYQYRLDEVARSNTLMPSEYVQLLDAHYAEIQHFFAQ